MQDNSFENLQTTEIPKGKPLVPGTDKTLDELRREGTYEDIPENVKNATGKDLDPLLNPPVDQMTVVQVLKQKIDSFVQKTMTYPGSKSHLQQVLAYLAMHPFMEDTPTFGYPKQKEIYDLGVEILTDKLLFFQLGIKEQQIAKDIREREPSQAIEVSPENLPGNEQGEKPKELNNGKEL